VIPTLVIFVLFSGFCPGYHDGSGQRMGNGRFTVIIIGAALLVQGGQRMQAETIFVTPDQAFLPGERRLYHRRGRTQPNSFTLADVVDTFSLDLVAGRPNYAGHRPTRRVVCGLTVNLLDGAGPWWPSVHRVRCAGSLAASAALRFPEPV
jgi:hypothetical protein